MNDLTNKSSPAPLLPAAFQLGVSTSAAQIEGHAPGDGAGPSIWDAFCAQPGKIKDGSDILVACDHIHRWAEDVERMRWLGLDAYRFSIAWPRVQPDGQGAWNEAGFGFYDRLVDGLLEAGIAPHATLHHWDLPQALQEAVGGWQSRETCARFADYAVEVLRRLGDRLVTIATLNEPWCVATLGYEKGQFAPGLKDRAAAMQVSHHLLLGHGLALKAMRETARGMAKSPQLGIVLNHTPAFAAEKTPADLQAARIADGLDVRWYMDPLFRGAYPADAVEYLGADAPTVEPGDFDVIRQPMDFLGINMYTRNWVSTRVPPVPAPNLRGVNDMGWEIVPEVLTQHLVRLTRDYMPPPMIITENGMANADVVTAGGVEDVPRVDYVREHLAAVARAIELGADVRGYMYWSLLDNFEWDSGYAKRFGLFRVDYETQARTPKRSAHWYREFIAAHKARR
ncbi:MAG: GH1 family beta-glucosidase [Burkholderiaceae bacterium]